MILEVRPPNMGLGLDGKLAAATATRVETIELAQKSENHHVGFRPGRKRGKWKRETSEAG